MKKWQKSSGEEEGEGTEEQIGIEMNVVSRDKVESMGSMEKLRFILDGVKSGNIVVLEGGLTAEEQMKLIELTMMEVDESFTGIEISGYPTKRGLLNLRRKTRLTIIGPAAKMKTIRKDKDLISAIISTT
ncbi:MAG: DUF2073 domain-containing protein [Methanophagales archaeon]|nr:DUF2073 domain-containing protein [Methanophagales archaeon]RLG33571.1 MAG: DUF2073 domain-containing protein [Methanosarcinales archaeon]MCW3137532.1 DUF2073 domain-containing protein [Methanophagales archaeon]MCW3139281.1 DUF2073 domain-containing protein [Methanophagales archaeon]MCW7069338.1 DUF2073 domain-containing protein [Methanophagales archaeon]